MISTNKQRLDNENQGVMGVGQGPLMLITTYIVVGQRLRVVITSFVTIGQ
jgi:hypothetical protein